MRRAAALVAALGAFLTGCGGNGDPQTAATDVETRPANPTTPAGYTVRTVKDEGFALALPGPGALSTRSMLLPVTR